MMQSHDWLGRKAKDKLTGFEGTVTAYCQYITGCDQFLLVPKAKSPSEMNEGKWFDEQRLELKQGKAVVLDNSRGVGACDPAPIKN